MHWNGSKTYAEVIGNDYAYLLPVSALKSVANIQKPFEKTFMDTMKLFMAIPDRINFLQLGRYGCFSEQTYRNLFEHETFDWFAFNGSIISKHLTGKRKAIAIDPSYIPKSGKKTRPPQPVGCKK